MTTLHERRIVAVRVMARGKRAGELVLSRPDGTVLLRLMAFPWQVTEWAATFPENAIVGEVRGRSVIRGRVNAIALRANGTRIRLCGDPDLLESGLLSYPPGVRLFI